MREMSGHRPQSLYLVASKYSVGLADAGLLLIPNVPISWSCQAISCFIIAQPSRKLLESAGLPATYAPVVELIATNPSEPDDKAPGGDLLDRLRALKLAQTTGATLTSKEARWILGKRPVVSEKVDKMGVNAWRLLN